MAQPQSADTPACPPVSRARTLADGWVKVVEPALSALFADAARELGGDYTPLDLADAVLHYHVKHDLVLRLCPRPLHQPRLQQAQQQRQ